MSKWQQKHTITKTSIPKWQFPNYLYALACCSLNLICLQPSWLTYRAALKDFQFQDLFCLVCSSERKKKHNNFSELLMWTMKRSAVNASRRNFPKSVSLSTLERLIASPLSLWCVTGIFFKLHFWVCWLSSWAHFSHFNIPDGRVACWWEAPKKTRGECKTKQNKSWAVPKKKFLFVENVKYRDIKPKMPNLAT